MQLQVVPPSIFRPVPPPLWLVTNGENTVGPVHTALLTRGVEHGRVPEYCHVRVQRGFWRRLVAVREIAALFQLPSRVDHQLDAESLTGLSRPIERIRDQDELWDYVTHLCTLATSAESAMFHSIDKKERPLTTRAVVGPMSNAQLGLELPESDLVLQSARVGVPVLGPPYGVVEDALAIRFASSRGGVGGAAMIPFFAGGTLVAMLELSRPGRGFRRADLKEAERLVQRALWRRSN